VLLVLIFSAGIAGAKPLPAWFLRSFNAQKLNARYSILSTAKPYFLEADFNGDKVNDAAIQVVDKKTKKQGVLIINGGQNKYFVFGASYKFRNEDFNDTNWLDGWRIYKEKIAFETTFDAEGDIKGSSQIKLKHPAIYIYAIEGDDEIAGQLIYWNGKKYDSIHQGE
jgi:hypothetical protein